MPVTREEFEKGEKPLGLTKLIANFLIPNRDKAYTIEEIHNNIFSSEEQGLGDLNNEIHAIMVLLLTGLIEERLFPNPSGNGWMSYFAAR